MTLEPQQCITCGDSAVAAIVVEVHGASAIVDVDGRREEVAVELVEPVEPGDVLLCHAGIALGKAALS
jgi:hydrogenase expression/formation protein HypC